jgi:hypothetical protein
MVQPLRLLLALATLVVLASGACGSDAPPAPNPVEDAALLNLTLRVEGMT